MMTVDAAKTLLGVETDQDLAGKLGKGPSAVSNWRAKGEVPAAVEREIRRILSARGLDFNDPDGIVQSLKRGDGGFTAQAPLTNLQREWIEIGLKMGDLEMLEWLVKIKKGNQ